ncbi:hypothetical protein AB0N73_16270 [Microbacterium sp. NPDC089189]|uniref:hypothetical protein n=1 Tax=Microbacterium sp. NPDC089189 TaxID=3154972 RepID=UPI0034450052
MSDFENRLRTLAEGEAWRVPSLGNVTIALNQLRALMDRISTETGLTGQTDAAAAAELQEAKGQVQSLIDYLETDLPDAITAANEVRQEAQARLESLGAGSLNSEQQQLIRSAAAGTTVFLGPFSIVAGEGAIAGANWFMGSQREGQAETAYNEVTQQMNTASRNIPEPPPLALSQDVPPPPPAQPDPIRGPIGGPVGGGPGGGQGVPTFPGGSGNPGGGSGTGIGSIPPYPDVPGTQPPIVMPFPPPTGQDPIIDIPPPGTIILNPDGPTDGGVPTLPGGPGVGTLPGGGSGGIGSGGGGLGGGMTSGLVAGGAGAALGGLGKAAAGGGLGRLGGAGGLGGLGGAGGAGGAGGLRAGGLGGGLTANAGGGAAGGLLGKGGTGGVGVGAAGEAGGSRGPAGMMGGGGGAPAGGGGRNEKKGRGLGGPVAPKLEDDADFGPRSENAGSGGRDE